MVGRSGHCGQGKGVCCLDPVWVSLGWSLAPQRNPSHVARVPHKKKTAKMAIPEGWPMPVLDYYCNIFWQCCPGTSGSRTGWGPCAKISRQGESQKMRKKETRKRGRTSFQQLGTTSNIFQKVGPDNQKRWSAMSIWQQVLGDVGVTILQIASGFKLHQSEGESFFTV